MRWLGLAPALVGLAFLSGQSAAADNPAPRETARTAATPGSAAPSRAPATAGKAPGTATPATVPPAAPSTPPAESQTEAGNPSSAERAAVGAPSVEPPPNGPLPQYYVEPQGPVERAARPSAREEVYEPPPPELPIYEPPPPTESHSLAPRTALWVGARVGLLIPFGSLWVDGFNGSNGYSYRRRMFASYASPGPAGEIDVGARLSRRYMVFAIYEHASFGTGGLDDKSFGGQERGASNFYGAGLRFSTDPGSVGFAMEVALGYRDFRAYWADGTELAMTDGFLDARIGLGADIRVNRWLSLSPMLVLGAGSFGSARWSGPLGSRSALDSTLDEGGQYGTFALQLGGHVDLY